MIIVEGVDGSGKTGLVQRLSTDLSLPIHERESTSVGGPVDNLWAWAKRDVTTMESQPLAIYDRHPLISEYIYGPITRQYILPEFLTEEASRYLQKLREKSLVVLCDPGVDEVIKNISNSSENQMDGVVEHSRALLYLYRAWKTEWAGRVIVWDYTKPDSYRAILRRCDVHAR